MERLKTDKTDKTGSWYYSTHGELSGNTCQTCLMCLFTSKPRHYSPINSYEKWGFHRKQWYHNG